MRKKTRKKFGRICALVVVGMFVAMTSMSTSANDPDDWTIGGDAFGGGTTQSLGTTTNDNLQIITNNQSRIFVKADGDVGIGTTSPTGRLHIAAPTNLLLKLDCAAQEDTWLMYRTAGADRWSIGVREFNNQLRFTPGYYTNNPSMVIETNSNVGIGTTSPGSRLEVKGSGTTSVTSALKVTDSLGTSLLFVRDDGNIGMGTAVPLSTLHIKETTPETETTLALESELSSITTGDHLGTILFMGPYRDGLGSTGAMIRAEASGPFTFENPDISPTSLQFYTQSRYPYNELVTPRMVITSEGNVGIGTTNPGTTLHVKTYQADRHIRVEREDQSPYPEGTYMDLISGGAFCAIDCVSTYDEVFQIQEDGTARLHIKKGGNVGIGTTSPVARTHILQEGMAEAFRVDDEAIDTTPFVIDQFGNVGIGTSIPGEKLEVAGTVQMTGFTMPTGASNGYVLTSDASGVGTWQPAPMGGSGTANYIPIFTAPETLGNSVIYENSGDIGIGTTSPTEALDIVGNVHASGGFIAGSTTEYRDGQILTDEDIDITTSTTSQIYIDVTNNRVGIGTTSPTEARMDIRSSSNQVQLLLGDRTGGGANNAYIGMDHFTAGNEECVALIGGHADTTYNDVYIGGGTTGNVQNAATEIRFFTAEDTTTLTGTEKMIIERNGDVGIGTTNPLSKLHVVEDFNYQLTLAYGGNVDTSLGTTSAGHFCIHPYSGKVGINTNSPGEALTIVGKLEMIGNIKTNGFHLSGDGDDEGISVDSDGKVGVGTISPDRIFDIEDSSAPQLRLTQEGLVYTEFQTTSSGHLYINPNSGFEGRNVGIGTSTPSYKLHVAGAIYTENDAYINGNLGIGTTEPSNKVEIIDGDSTNYRAGLIVEQSGDAGTTGYGIKVTKTGTSYRNIAGYFSASGATDFNTALWIESGNVGIGTLDPRNLLDVKGGIAIGASMAGFFTAPANGAIIQGYVGIGTNNPNEQLDIDGKLHMRDNIKLNGNWLSGDGGSEGVYVASDGKVGIGTTSPNEILDVNGKLYMRDNIKLNGNWLSGDGDNEGVYVASDGRVGIGMTNPSSNAKLHLREDNGDIAIAFSEDVNTPKWILGIDDTDSNFKIDSDAVLRDDSDFVITEYGNIGIGTGTPQNSLDVEGRVAIGISYSGTSLAPYNGLIVEGDVGIGTSSPLATLDVNGGLATNIVTWTSSDMASSSDFTILVDASSNDVTILLPQASNAEGQILVIKRIDDTTSGKDVIVDAYGTTEKIDGSLIQTLNSQYESIMIQCDGSNWYII